MAFVYWIKSKDHSDILTEGYIGFTSKTVADRIKSHKFNYKKFSRDGKSGGCLKLYSEIKNSGGWLELEIVTLLEGSKEYCLDIENKLRPNENIGWNVRVGGDNQVMFKREVSSETRRKLVEVRKTWVMSQETKDRLSIERQGDGNPRFGVKPWEQVSADLITWQNAHLVHEYWLASSYGTRRLTKNFPQFSYWGIDTMIRKFRSGWNPIEDSSWLEFKESRT